MEHFTLPDHFTDADVQKVKDAALRKMAVAFNNHKKTVWTAYVKGGKNVGERSRNSKFSYVSPRSIYGETSNKGKGVHLHTLVDRERKRSNERG